MQAIELVQLAAMVAVHGRLIVQSRGRFPDPALELYWTASKCRQERWARALKNLSNSTSSSHAPQATATCLPAGSEPILDEVLNSEVLTRVWAAVCRAADRSIGTDDAAPVAASVLAGHLEARHRVLNLMVYGYGLGVEEAVALNRRRLRNERWTDMLLAFIQSSHVSEYGYEHRRVAEWSRLLRDDRHAGSFGAIYSLALTTITTVEGKSPPRHTGNEDLNRRIAASVLGCLPASIFDSLGSPMSSVHLSAIQGLPDSQGHLNLGDTSYRSGSDWSGHRGNRTDSL